MVGVYDALLLLSFGGPEGPEDVLPFLANVVRGRPVPRERLLAAAGAGAPELDKIRHYFNHPGFVAANAGAVRAALARLPEPVRDRARLVYTAHSIPAQMDAASGPGGHLYSAQLHEAARLVTEA